MRRIYSNLRGSVRIFVALLCAVLSICAVTGGAFTEQNGDMPSAVMRYDDNTPPFTGTAIQTNALPEPIPDRNYPNEQPPDQNIPLDVSSDVLPDMPAAESATANTAAESPAIHNEQIIGSVRVPAAGLSDILAVETSLNAAQQALETCACLLNYDNMGLPGQAPISVIGGHNYMEFNKLKNAKIGDDVILEMYDGVFTYTIYDIKILAADTVHAIPTGNLILYTCYPFDERFNPTANANFFCKPKTD